MKQIIVTMSLAEYESELRVAEQGGRRSGIGNVVDILAKVYFEGDRSAPIAWNDVREEDLLFIVDVLRKNSPNNSKK